MCTSGIWLLLTQNPPLHQLDPLPLLQESLLYATPCLNSFLALFRSIFYISLQLQLGGGGGEPIVLIRASSPSAGEKYDSQRRDFCCLRDTWVVNVSTSPSLHVLQTSPSALIANTWERGNLKNKPGFSSNSFAMKQDHVLPIHIEIQKPVFSPFVKQRPRNCLSMVAVRMGCGSIGTAREPGSICCHWPLGAPHRALSSYTHN